MPILILAVCSVLPADALGSPIVFWAGMVLWPLWFSIGMASDGASRAEYVVVITAAILINAILYAMIGFVVWFMLHRIWPAMKFCARYIAAQWISHN